ncbi:hypothetical protein NKH77_37740 [Streptomyces sp. M19]
MGPRLGDRAVGAPVLDARTGAVIAVLGTALRGGRRTGPFAVPLRAVAAADPGGPLAALLDRNGVAVPAHGRELNLAGAVQLAAASLGPRPRPGERHGPVERAEIRAEFDRFAADPRAVVCGLVGDPVRAAAPNCAPSPHAARTAPRPRRPCGCAAPSCGRATKACAVPWRGRWPRRAVSSTRPRSRPPPRRDPDGIRDGGGEWARRAGCVRRGVYGRGHLGGGGGGRGPSRARRRAAAAHPARRAEELPPVLAHRLPAWVARTCDWLRESGARLVVACRPEHWERFGTLFPDGALYRPERARADARPVRFPPAYGWATSPGGRPNSR